jgi:putative transposase
MDAVLVTAAWVHWWNESRLHSACGDIPPAEFEARRDAATVA